MRLVGSSPLFFYKLLIIWKIHLVEASSILILTSGQWASRNDFCPRYERKTIIKCCYLCTRFQLKYVKIMDFRSVYSYDYLTTFLKDKQTATKESPLWTFEICRLLWFFGLSKLTKTWKRVIFSHKSIQAIPHAPVIATRKKVVNNVSFFQNKDFYLDFKWITLFGILCRDFPCVRPLSLERNKKTACHLEASLSWHRNFCTLRFIEISCPSFLQKVAKKRTTATA